MIDAVLVGLLLVALYFNKNIKPAFVAYGLCVVYQNTLFDSHSAVINHVIYGLIFIPCVYFATIKLASAMLVYASFHLLVALDYFFYADIETLISIYYNYVQIALALSLIYIGSKAVDNGISNDSGFDWHRRSSMDNL